MKGISRYFPGGTGKTPSCAKRAFRGAVVRRRQPQDRRHPNPTPETTLNQRGVLLPPNLLYRWEVVGGMGRDVETAPQCPDADQGRLTRWWKSNNPLGEPKQSVGEDGRPRRWRRADPLVENVRPAAHKGASQMKLRRFTSAIRKGRAPLLRFADGLWPGDTPRVYQLPTTTHQLPTTNHQLLLHSSTINLV